MISEVESGFKMDNFFNNLEKYGFVKDDVMKRFVDDVEFYRECFVQVMNDEAFDELKNYIDEGNTKAAFDCAHGLKGVLSNIGIMLLFDKVSDIVEVLRGTREGNLDEMYAELIRLRQECLMLAE